MNQLEEIDPNVAPVEPGDDDGLPDLPTHEGPVEDGDDSVHGDES